MACTGGSAGPITPGGRPETSHSTRRSSVSRPVPAALLRLFAPSLRALRSLRTLWFGTLSGPVTFQLSGGGASGTHSYRGHLKAVPVVVWQGYMTWASAPFGMTIRPMTLPIAQHLTPTIRKSGQRTSADPKTHRCLQHGMFQTFSFDKLQTSAADYVELLGFEWGPARGFGAYLETPVAEAWIVMSAILILLTVSSLLGLVLGFYFSWLAIGMSGLVLAFLSAVVLRHQGFGSLTGIAIIVACLTANQVAHLIGVTLTKRGDRSLPHDHPNHHPGEHSHNHIASEYK
jgi:hypothetical protein